MTATQTTFTAGALTAPVVDYEPAPLDPSAAAAPCPAPVALRRPAPRLLRPSPIEPAETPPPQAAAFADAALRRVLEVLDRRRPIAQLRGMLTPALLDMVFTMSRSAAPEAAAVLRRVRLRGSTAAAEVFATYTRGQRVRAIACRIEVDEGRWHMVALQIG